MTTETKSLRRVTRRAAILPLCALPLLLGADNGGGCGSFSSTSPAPNVTGNWAITTTQRRAQSVPVVRTEPICRRRRLDSLGQNQAMTQ